ncbi:hypothetical protein O981_26405 [Mycobacterium avium 10-5560]|nr:hypothetical protein O981_26405 [Mycobacterium avium 10-5560]MBZ4575095.1 hypothetical protein [Mycobacterium avium subsp. hominissuis]QBC87543.1 hypothetical protein B6K05_024325 [Mycobacterium avium subsp. hominissuis]QCR71197.1 hypothetical protein FCV17_04750 [Mycobacterium avium subsp. hominissuis]QCR78633.1 hypothetical protein FCV16_21465 [Mycobacterium avium subsp. hominissuis]
MLLESVDVVIQQMPLRSRQLRVLLQLDRLTDLIVEISQRAFERGNLAPSRPLGLGQCRRDLLQIGSDFR